MAGLKKDNFVVQEDGREQKISVFDKESALPISIALAIDTSLSTRHDLPLEQASAKRFVHDIVRPVDALSVFSFSEAVSQSPFGYTADMKRIDDGIDHIRLGAATALFDCGLSGLAFAGPPPGTESFGADHRRRRHDQQNRLQRGGACR